jgi:hypothetical protein
MGGITLGAAKRGTGKLVKLPAGENDVLHALAETGGLPGLDARNEIVIVRRRKGGASVNCPPAGLLHGRVGSEKANVIQQTSGVRGHDGWGHTPIQAPNPRTAFDSQRSRLVAQRDAGAPPVSSSPYPSGAAAASPW